MTELERACEWDRLAGNTCEKRTLSDPQVRTQIDLIKEEVHELLKADHNDDLENFLKEAGDCLKVITGAVWALGYNPEELLGLINDSNFSKYITDSYEADLAVESYLSKERYSDVYAEQVGDYYIIRGYTGADRSGKGKILKPPLSFREANIKEWMQLEQDTQATKAQESEPLAIEQKDPTENSVEMSLERLLKL